MKIGFYNYYNYYNNNKMFLTSESEIGDELSYPNFYLGKYLTNFGYEVETIDVGNINTYDIVIFFDLPKIDDKLFSYLKSINHKSLYLFIVESPLIRKENWDPLNHIVFKKIFTWNDQLIDSEKYFKFFLPNKLKSSFRINNHRKFCTIIAGNKIIAKTSNELYSARINTIRWFERYHPLEFDLYGFGWDNGEPRSLLKYIIQINNFTCKIYNNLLQYSFFNKILRFLNKSFPSYKGQINSKNVILQNYKFSICFENANKIPGYISEKIFDCFFAGTIPIYLGASNIHDFIPLNTFIDRRKYNSNEELYDFLKGMSENEYNSYLDAISIFLKSDSIKQFGAEIYASTILNEIILNQ